ncbi:MAG: methylenetetrahydrofolate reductase [Desulfovibrionaceae bacterium]|nr:methylenetetrahydrofolate reductase [Desulfovibrionaceae bacterium]
MRIGTLIAERSKPFVSLEFFPPAEKEALPDFYNVVARLQSLNPLFASVTYGAGGSKQDRTLGVTAELVRMGITTMAHLTCVGASCERLSLFLKSLKDVGVENVLALRGDPPKDGNFSPSDSSLLHASDLARFITDEDPAMGIAVACYPTPHPESPSFASDRKYTAYKLKVADFGVTQLFFDVREYFALVSDLQALGVEKPVIPGILTVQSFASLRRILSLSGASIPGKLYLSMEEADRKGGAQAVREAGIAFAARQIRELLDGGALGVHLYTLNRADICLELMDRVGSL